MKSIGIARLEIKRKPYIWNSGHLPKGYPTQCDLEQLNNIIQDLSDEQYQKIRGGKDNKSWEKLISDLIKSGRDELNQRTQAKKSTIWFSMNNPVIYIIVIVILAAIAYIAYKFGWPLKFGSN